MNDPIEKAAAEFASRRKQQSLQYVKDNLSFTPNGESQYDLGMKNYEGINVEDFRYKRQSFWDTLGNIAVKTVANTTLNAVDTLAFIPATLLQTGYDAINPNEEVGIKNLYSNFASDYIDDIKKKIEEAAPVYRSEANINNEILPSIFNMKTVDNIFNGISYMAGMVGGVGATKLIAKYGVKGLGKLGGVFAKIVDEGGDLNAVGTLLKDTGGTLNALKKGKSALADKAYQAYGAIVESAAEARQTQEGVYEELKSKHVGEYTDEDEANYKSIAEKAAGANFAVNTVITGMFNSAFNKIISSKYTNNMVDAKRILKEGDLYKKGELTKYQKAYRGLFGEVAGDAAQEGTQELGQFASNELWTNFFARPTKEGVGSYENLTNALYDTYNVLGSREGIESAAIGALIGGGATAIRTRGDNTKKELATDLAIEKLNKVGQEKQYDKFIGSIANSTKSKEIMNGAILDGDRVTFETAKAKMFYDIADAYISTGKEEDLVEQLKNSQDQLNENPDVFKNTYGIKGEFDTESAKSTIENLLGTVNKIKQTKNKFLENYGHNIDEEGLKLLTISDVFYNDFVNREDQLIKEFNDNGVDYQDFTKRRSVETVKNLQGELATLQNKIATEKNYKNLDTLNSDLVRIQTKLNTALTNDNYLQELDKELTNIQEPTKKKKNDPYLQTQFKKQLEDLKTIQELKNSILKYHNKLITDGKFRDKVKEQLDKKETDQIYKSEFTVGDNTIDIGDVFNLGLNVKHNDKKQTKGTNNEFVEVADLGVKNKKGLVTFKTNNGRLVTLTAEEFKSKINPIGRFAKDETGKNILDDNGNNVIENPQFKKSYVDPEVQFFNRFKDRAIEMTYYSKTDKADKTVVGKLGFSKSGQLVLRYKDIREGKNGKFVTLQNVLFTDYGKGYKILDQQQTTEFEFGFINDKKIIETENKLNEVKTNIKSDIAKDEVIEKGLQEILGRKATKAELQAEVAKRTDKKGKTEGDLEAILRDLLDYTQLGIVGGKETLQDIDDQIDHNQAVIDLNPIITDTDRILNILPDLDNGLKNIKLAMTEDLVDKLNGIDSNLINLSEEEITQLFPNNDYAQFVKDFQSSTPEQKIAMLESKNIPTEELGTSIEEFNKAKNEARENLVNEIASKLPITKENVENILDNYLKQLIYFKQSLKRKPYSYIFTNDKSNNNPKTYESLYARPLSIARTTGNSEKTDNVYMQRFYRRITDIIPGKHQLVRIKEEEKSTYGLENELGKQNVFFKVTDGTETLGVTTLPLPFLYDDYGRRLRFGTEAQNKAIYDELKPDLKDVVRGTQPLSFVQLETLYETLRFKYKAEDSKLKVLEQIFEGFLLPVQKLRESDISEVAIDAVANGIPVKTDQFNKLQLVLPPSYINGSDVVVYPKKENIFVGKQEFGVFPGKTYLKNEERGNLISIIGGKLSSEDKSILLNGLIAVGKGAEIHKVQDTLSDRFYFNTKGQDSLLHYVEDNGEFKLLYGRDSEGNQKSISYKELITPELFALKEADLNESLGKIRYNTNNKALKSEGDYQFYDINANGDIIEGKIVDSYSDYIKETYEAKLLPRGEKQFENGHTNFTVDLPTEYRKENAKEESEPVSTEEQKLPKDAELNLGNLFGNTSDQIDNGSFDAAANEVAKTTTKTNIEPTSEPQLAEASKSEFELLADERFTYQGYMSEQDYNEAQTRFKELYDIDLEVVEGLVDNDAWGKVTSYAEVILSNKAIRGTQFHEEFHIVSQFALTPEERTKLYDEWRKENNEENFSDNVVEEKLAEEHRYYRLGKQQRGFIKKMFDKITDWLSKISKIFKSKNSYKEEVFNNIYEGNYKITKKEAFPHYAKAGLTEDEITKTYDKALTLFSKGVSKVHPNRDFGLIQVINDGEKLTRLLNDKEYVGKLFNRQPVDLLEISLSASLKDLGLLEKLTEPRKLLNDFKQYVTSTLKTQIDDVENEIYESLGEEKPKDGIGNAEAAEVNHFEKSQSKLRVFLYSIPDTPIDESLHKLYSNLSNIDNSKEFFARILSSKEKFFQTVAKKLMLDKNLVQLQNEGFSVEDINEINDFRALFYQAIGKMNNDYKVLKYKYENGKYRVYFLDASKEKRVEKSIDKYFSAMKPFIGLTNKLEVNRDYDSPNYIVKQFAKIGIKLSDKLPIDENYSKLESIYKFLFDKIESKKDKKTDYNSELSKLAELEAKYTQDKSVYNIFNAAGKPIYTIQNFHGLAKRMNEFPKLFDNLINLNGINADVVKPVYDNGEYLYDDIDPKSVATSKLTEIDLQALYFNSVMSGSIPYTFNSDKSSLWGMEIKGEKADGKLFSIKPSKTIGKKGYIEKVVKPFIELHYDYQVSLINSTTKKYSNDVMSFFNDGNTSKKYYENNINKTKLVNKLLADLETRSKEAYNYFSQNEVIANSEILEGYKDSDPTYPYYQYVANYAMGQMQMTRYITGDLVYYSDPAKRLYGLTSAKSNIMTHNIKEYNESNGTNISERTRSLILDDVIVDGHNGTDAQGYIAYDSAVFMMRQSGNWNPNMTKLHNIIKANKSSEEVDAASKEFNAYMKALKPQGFGFNEDGVPTFYKLSVIILNEQYTKGKNLDYIRQLMSKKNLDMVMFKSANKVGNKASLKMYDETGNFNKELIKQVNPNTVQLMDWKWFSFQVETSDRHETATFGTQARKMIMVDLPKVFATPIAGYDSLEKLVKAHDALINQKTNENLDRLRKELDIESDLTPNNINKFKLDLITEAISRGKPREFIKHIEKLESFDLINNKLQLESIMLSMIDMTKHKMSGDMKVQVSSVGFERQTDKEGNPTNILTDRALKYDGNGMEVYLPYHYAEHFKGKVGKLENGIYPVTGEIEPLVGFRIPTQYLNSMDKIIIKGFLPYSRGNEIIVPFEITTKTGSDFDVDKLTIFFNKYKVNYKSLVNAAAGNTQNKIDRVKNILLKIENLDEAQTEQLFAIEGYTDPKFLIQLFNQNKKETDPELEETEIAAIQNMAEFIEKYKNNYYEYDVNSTDNKIIKLYADILDAQKHLAMLPNDSDPINKIFQKIQDAKGITTELTKKDYLNPMKVVSKRDGFMSAKNTLGIQAVNSTSHSIAQQYGITINSDSIARDSQGNVVASLKDLLKIFGFKGDLRLDLITSKDKNGVAYYISQFLSQTIDVTVDVAKNDRISAVNFNTETTKVINLLLRLGIDPESVFYFVNQPSIVEYVKNKARRKSNTSEFVPEKVTKSGMSFTKEINLVKELSNPSNQDLLLEAYINLESHGDMLDKFNKVITFDTRGLGSNTAENYFLTSQYKILAPELRAYFNNFDKLFGDTFIGNFKLLADNAVNTTDMFFPFKKILRNNPVAIQRLNKLVKAFKSTSDKVREINRMESKVQSYLIQKKLNYKYFTQEVLDTLPALINQRQNNPNYSSFSNNPLIKDLVASEKNISLYGAASLNVEESNRYSRAWEELFEQDEKFAKDLAIFSYFQSGTINSPITLFHIIPYDVKESLGVNELDTFDLSDIEKVILDNSINDMFTEKTKQEDLYNLKLAIADDSDSDVVIRSPEQLEGYVNDLAKTKKVTPEMIREHIETLRKTGVSDNNIFHTIRCL